MRADSTPRRCDSGFDFDWFLNGFRRSARQSSVSQSESQNARDSDSGGACFNDSIIMRGAPHCHAKSSAMYSSSVATSSAAAARTAANAAGSGFGDSCNSRKVKSTTSLSECVP